MQVNLPAAIIAACVFINLYAPPAVTCTFLPPTFEDMQLSIADGDVLPTNLVMFSKFVGPDDGLSYWLLAPDGNATRLNREIDEAEGLSRLIPDQPLIVDTAYRLVFVRGNEPPEGEAFNLRLTFTTKAAEEAPPSPPIVSSETKEIFADPFSTCGPVPGETWARFFVEPNDAEPIGMLRLIASDGAVRDINLAPFISRDDEGNIFLSETAAQGGLEDYRVVSTTHSGIDSPATQVQVYLGCPGSCSAADASVPALGFLLLLALRRRSAIVRDGAHRTKQLRKGSRDLAARGPLTTGSASTPQAGSSSTRRNC